MSRITVRRAHADDQKAVTALVTNAGGTLTSGADMVFNAGSTYDLSVASLSSSYTTEAGGVVELRVKLFGMTPVLRSPCVFAIATTNPSEAVVLYPSMLVISADNYAYEHPVHVVGVWDEGVVDGDVSYEVKVTALDEPGDGCADVFGFTAGDLLTSIALVNRDIDSGTAASALGSAVLAFSPSSEQSTTEAGGQVELIATLTQAPVSGTRVMCVFVFVGTSMPNTL